MGVKGLRTMIPVNALVEVFRNIIGWPYATPGSNNAQGIDCSGAFVYAYSQFGQRIYHGSNRIIREYCHDVRTITSASQLRVGMAIFKSRKDLSRMKAEYKPGGKYYDPALPYDYYHMGLIASVSPLEIINATSPRARIDSDLSKWCCAGYLNAVDYADEGGGDGDGDGGDGGGESTRETPFPAVVTAASGSTVNLRKSPTKSAAILYRVPLGQLVLVLDAADATWWHVRYQQSSADSITGYMMREFLQDQCS